MGMTRREFVEVCAAAIGVAIVGECKLFNFAYDLGAKSATESESESEDDEDEEPPNPSPTD